MTCNSTKLPLLLERVGERIIKSTTYTPLIPTWHPGTLAPLSLNGEGAGTCVDTDALSVLIF
jgi:hypothetical protein